MVALVFGRIVPGVVTAALLFVWLRRAGYPSRAAGVLTGIVLAQGGFLVAIAEPDHSLWLALGVAATAASIAAFAGRDDARHAILVGGSLAAIQVCDPMGGLIATGMLPAALAAGHGRVTDPRRAAGLYTLLLFLPVMTALILLYVAHVYGTVSPVPFAAAGPAPARRIGLWRFGPVLGLALVLVPAMAGLHRNRRGRAALAIAAGIIGSAAFDGLTGTLREPVSLLAAAAPLTVAGLAARDPRSDRRAYAIAAMCTVLSWIVLFWLQRPSVPPV